MSPSVSLTSMKLATIFTFAVLAVFVDLTRASLRMNSRCRSEIGGRPTRKYLTETPSDVHLKNNKDDTREIIYTMSFVQSATELYGVISDVIGLACDHCETSSYTFMPFNADGIFGMQTTGLGFDKYGVAAGINQTYSDGINQTISLTGDGEWRATKAFQIAADDWLDADYDICSWPLAVEVKKPSCMRTSGMALRSRARVIWAANAGPTDEIFIRHRIGGDDCGCPCNEGDCDRNHRCNGCLRIPTNQTDRQICYKKWIQSDCESAEPSSEFRWCPH